MNVLEKALNDTMLGVKIIPEKRTARAQLRRAIEDAVNDWAFKDITESEMLEVAEHAIKNVFRVEVKK